MTPELPGSHLSPLNYRLRHDTCHACAQWVSGACYLGHRITSSLGCPLGRFPGHNGAELMSLKTAPLPESWPELLAQFRRSMATWQAQGFKIAPKDVSDARFYGKCQSCEYYSKFRCSACGCVAYLKCHLAHERCPANKWSSVQL